MYIFVIIMVNSVMVGSAFENNLQVVCTLNEKGAQECTFPTTVNSHNINHPRQLKRPRIPRSLYPLKGSPPKKEKKGSPKKENPEVPVYPDYPVYPVQTTPIYPFYTGYPVYATTPTNPYDDSFHATTTIYLDDQRDSVRNYEILEYNVTLDYKPNSKSNNLNFEENTSYVFDCLNLSGQSNFSFRENLTNEKLPDMGGQNEKPKWKLNGKLLKNSKRIKFEDNTMKIKPLIVSDTGRITCEKGDQNFSTKIGVEALPKLILEPMFNKVDKTMIIIFQFLANNRFFNNAKVYVNGEQQIPDILVNSSMDLVIGLEDLPGYSEIRSNKAIIDYPIYGKGDCPPNDEWGPKNKGEVQKRLCPKGYTGIMERKCISVEEWGKVDRKGCQPILRESIKNTRDDVKKIIDGITGLDADAMTNVTKKIKKLVGEDVNEKEEKVVVDMIYNLATCRGFEEDVNDVDTPKLKEETENMMGSVSGMLKKFNNKKKKCDKDCSMKLLISVNVYSNIKSSKFTINANMPNLRFQRQHLEANAIEDVNRDSPISLLPSFFENKKDKQEYYVTTSTINDLAGLLPLKKKDSFINSAMISMDVSDGEKNVVHLESDKYFVNITLNHLKTRMYSTSSCVYWKTNGGLEGEWVNEGCVLVSQNAKNSVYECNHLTNFALLTSFNENILESNKQILSYISLVGCIISIIALLLTIAYYYFSWRKVKSKRAVLVLNLCVSLIIANLLLLIEYSILDKSQTCCQTLAILLHFFFLAVFFAMLSISIHLLFSVFFVFTVFTKKIITAMVVFSWVCALLIVVISMGVMELDGYGTNNNCWLSVKDGLLWAFVGPVLLILLFNMAVVVAVLVKICGMKNPNSEKNNKFKSAVRNVFILNPIMGLTWAFGILSINNQLIAFAYIFTILNSFQGLFIFLLYALLDMANKPKHVKAFNVKRRSTLHPARENTTSSTNDSKDTTDGFSSDQSKSLGELPEHEYVRISYTRYQPSFKNS